MATFTYNLASGRVVFGIDTLKTLPEQLSNMKLHAAIVLCTPQQISLAKEIETLITGSCAGLFSEATMHTPTHITDKAISYVQSAKADCVISAGGGSTIGLGKAISVRTKLPHICIPTSYAGSEMTPILGETADGMKTTRRDTAILPGLVIYDVNLTNSLPISMTATSGINAIAHAVETLYAANANPVLDLLALESIKSLATALPTLVASPNDHSARYTALYGAWLCGICLGNSDMALHHKLCHTLGGSFNLPHAETHTIVLPHALAYNAPSIPKTMERIAEALPDSNGDAINGLNVLLTKLNVKRALKDFGMKEEDVDKAAQIATVKPYPNPAKVEYEKLRETIRRAWAGEDARADM